MRAEVWLVTIAPLPGIAVLLIAGAGRGSWTSMKIAGLILSILGTVLLTIARFNLGDSFSIAAQAKKLVKHGIYSKIRHPVYVFSILIFCGVALYFDLLPLLIVPAAFAPLQFVRACKEERVLEEAFGEEYRAYKRSTWF